MEVLEGAWCRRWASSRRNTGWMRSSGWRAAAWPQAPACSACQRRRVWPSGRVPRDASTTWYVADDKEFPAILDDDGKHTLLELDGIGELELTILGELLGSPYEPLRVGDDEESLLLPGRDRTSYPMASQTAALRLPDRSRPCSHRRARSLTNARLPEPVDGAAADGQPRPSRRPGLCVTVTWARLTTAAWITPPSRAGSFGRRRCQGGALHTTHRRASIP